MLSATPGLPLHNKNNGMNMVLMALISLGMNGYRLTRNGTGKIHFG